MLGDGEQLTSRVKRGCIDDDEVISRFQELDSLHIPGIGEDRCRYQGSITGRKQMQRGNLLKRLDNTLFKGEVLGDKVHQPNFTVLQSEVTLHTGKTQIPVDDKNPASQLSKRKGNIADDGTLAFSHGAGSDGEHTLSFLVIEHVGNKFETYRLKRERIVVHGEGGILVLRADFHHGNPAKNGSFLADNFLQLVLVLDGSIDSLDPQGKQQAESSPQQEGNSENQELVRTDRPEWKNRLVDHLHIAGNRSFDEFHFLQHLTKFQTQRLVDHHISLKLTQATFKNGKLGEFSNKHITTLFQYLNSHLSGKDLDKSLGIGFICIGTGHHIDAVQQFFGDF
ncbi:hypothetical protein SDC9_56280 [bioreactor metagenome]|uniref:Uncharacterized protein n=1 Tax=bioreactor metagenome TaxID=1076179 RepID=A0A644X1F6_9ZZZZ